MLVFAIQQREPVVTITIYIHIYVCVCVCVCVYIYIDLPFLWSLPPTHFPSISFGYEWSQQTLVLQYLWPCNQLLFSHSVVSDSVTPPGSSVHGILQARILEWVAIFFSRGSSQSRDWTWVSCIGRQILYHWAAKEVHRNHEYFQIILLLWLLNISWSIKQYLW